MVIALDGTLVIAKRFDSVLSEDGVVLGGNIKKEEESEWDWERWKKHFKRIDDQYRLLSFLKSQLNGAAKREDYEDAARLKVAIAAASTNDAVGRVMSSFNRAVLEERYKDAVYLRDKAGAGLVDWWSGISEDVKDPFGLIVQITAEHGRYVARSYNPRKMQVILPSSLVKMKTDNSADDSDLLDESSGFQTFLRDMIPGVKVKVMKVNSPGKVDKDFISKVIDQIADEEDEDEENDFDIEDIVVEEETKSEANDIENWNLWLMKSVTAREGRK
uniref:Uncharacterized protein n=1 Tax=Brassica campestris TaxID=3711 RepID=M4F7B5_BRACM